jgi:hypothetical protein
MGKKRKSCREQLEESRCLPAVEPIPDRMKRTWGEGTLVIPAPKEVDAIMRKVPQGKLITINQIREILAEKHNATIG